MRLHSIQQRLLGRRACPLGVACTLPRPRIASMAVSAAPAFVYSALVQEIGDQAALDMLEQLQRVDISVSDTSLGRNGLLPTAFVGPSTEELQSYPDDAPVVVLLHSFDSSCLEMRRLYPILAQTVPTYAVDLVGWGFTDHSWLAGNKSRFTIGPEQKREHLRAFLEQQVPPGRRVVLLGTSVGGAIAMDFAIAYPEKVDKLVMADPQVFIDGIGPLGLLPRFAAELGVKLLQQYWLRESANVSAYHNQKFATADAVKVGRLHTFLPGWLEANVAFMSSGGYRMAKRLKDVKVDTLVLWGRNDQILNPEWANRFPTELPGCKLVFVEECGHLPHLEHADLVAEQLLNFAGVKQPAEVAGAPALQTVMQ